MTHARRAFGAWGEQRAAAHLVEQGMVLLARNWRCRTGEIDIVARDGETLVFVEVKTRRSETFGPPAAAVVARKVSRLRRLAAEWLATSGLRPPAVRFDVVSVLPRHRGEPYLEHLKDAFQ
ncbi:MAG TPA: YraN family protein [Micromonosporaceae bacterium]|nr:YraN family protein [Micromonosporaceae bacterium]